MGILMLWDDICNLKYFMTKPFLIFFFCFLFNASFAQTKGAKKIIDTLDEFVVTSTRTETRLSNVAVPTQFISKKYIQQSGSLKLQDIIQEQTGITVVNSTLSTSLNGYPNPFGQGIQMLGLDPAYTAVLIDCEPLIGRNAGILKLGRIATGNIKQIEIVKGPSSSLYGSEAMAGVINIITESPKTELLDIQLHGENNTTIAQTISYSNLIHKTGIQLFANRFSTKGYDLDPSTYGNTSDPYRDLTLNLKLTQELSKKAQLLLSIRNYDSKQDNNYKIEYQSQPSIVNGFTTETDNSIFGQLTIKTSEKNKLFFRTFFDNYQNKSFVNLEGTNVRFDETSFIQSIFKPEIQIENSAGKSRKFIGGIGSYFETIDASRYAGKQNLYTAYTFLQNEWYLMQNKLTLIGGARLDKRTDFDLNISPRLAVAYKPNTHLKFTASAGYGFKAPDFRHMYLNFYNTQIGYSLIGSNVLSEELIRLHQNGELEQGANISNYLNDNKLLPEKSFGYHLGAKYSHTKFTAELGLFRNDINNLIDVYLLPFRKSNNGSIYSYHNINRIYTQGAEVELKYNLSKKINLSGGYQYLEAKDKEVLNDINENHLYKRDPLTYVTTLVKKSDYFGLANRSKHSFNTKISWNDEKSGMNIFLRVVFRGKYGYSDINGNGIIDDDREMVKGYWLANFTVEKKLGKKFSLQAGVNNIFNYTNAMQMPNIAGRLYFVNFNYSINHLFNKN